MVAEQKATGVRLASSLMPDPDLCTEEEVVRLVHSFYSKVRNDPVLAPIFESHVADWELHLAKLVDFWSSALRGTARYKGAPIPKHVALPGLTAALFHRWLALFRETTQALGNAALRQRADDLAHRIAGSLWYGYQARHGAPANGGQPPRQVATGRPKKDQAMTHPSLTIICQEHRALSAMLRAITLLLGEHRRRNTLPDFDALQAMLFYVDEFPEKLHHPKESRLLFPKLRGRDAHTDAVLDRLDRDHAHGEKAIRELEHALLGFRMMSETGQGEARRRHFEALMKQYADFYLDHMRVEETEILPLAQAVLSADEWAELDAAFLANRDALAGREADEAYRPLFRKIVGALQNSGSFGLALEAFAGAAIPAFSPPH